MQIYALAERGEGAEREREGERDYIYIRFAKH